MDTDELAQFKPLIGDLIFQAFFEDQSFRETMKTLNSALQEAIPLDVENPISFGLDVLNAYLVTSFHSTRAIELVNRAVKNGLVENQRISRLMSLQHAFLLEAVISLNCAQSFFQIAPVKKLIGDNRSKGIEAAFSNNFPQLRDARNALAHQDERTFAIVDGVCQIEKLDFLEAIERMQFISLSGPKLEVKDKAAKSFVFEFPSDLIQATAKTIASIIAEKQ